eukprot:scaffold192250_cov49-Attheya_sp.AAC.2
MGSVEVALASMVLAPRALPEALVIGYAHNAGAKVEKAIQQGVNVVCWSFVDMVARDNDPCFETNLDLMGIAKLRSKFPNVLHLAAIGGWNGPHPPSLAGVTGQDWCRAFVDFNSKHENVFDGIDWDLEGHDDRAAPTSVFTKETLDIMADMSTDAKKRYGLIVSMAPAESYLDALLPSPAFSYQLHVFPEAWSHSEADRAVVESNHFAHAGVQCYAYVLHRTGVDIFDWISLQLYEAYSRFLFDTTRAQTTTQPHSQTYALVQRALMLNSGFDVELPSPYGMVSIQIPLDRLVFGVANGWADGIKFPRVDPNSLAQANQRLKEMEHGQGFRGAMFWTIEEEGRVDAEDMASSLASIFSVNITSENQQSAKEL